MSQLSELSFELTTPQESKRKALKPSLKGSIPINGNLGSDPSIESKKDDNDTANNADSQIRTTVQYQALPMLGISVRSLLKN